MLRLTRKQITALSYVRTGDLRLYSAPTTGEGAIQAWLIEADSYRTGIAHIIILPNGDSTTYYTNRNGRQPSFVDFQTLVEREQQRIEEAQAEWPAEA